MKKVVLFGILMCVCLPLMLLAQIENWVYRYDGPGSYFDQANSIVYGDDGNLYVAGYCDQCVGPWAVADFLVTSLTVAGDTNWVYRHNGPGSSWDQANSIVYGDDGNLYVAGHIGDMTSERAFAVYSLTTAGEINWLYGYYPGNDGMASSIVYGADGNVYAAGHIGDFVVISFTTAGDTNWVYRYDGPGYISGQANSIIYGPDGNIYAAGYYEGAGNDLIVISLTTTGDTNWVYQYNGPGSIWDEATSLVYGADGNLYVAGYSTGIGTDFDLTVISLTTVGDTNWIYRYNGPVDSHDAAHAIVYGTDGNIYAAGYSFGTNTHEDLIVISLTASGDTNWIYRYDEPGYSSDAANSLVYGADGNINVAGISGSDFIVISLATNSDTNWVYRYSGPGGWGQANSIVYGADGNLYVAGFSYGINTESDFTVISLSPDLGVEDQNTFTVNNHWGAIIFRGPLQLPKDKSCRVFDITGRTIAPDKMKPGIYFIEIDGQITQKVIKVR